MLFGHGRSGKVPHNNRKREILILHFADEPAKKPQAVPHVVPELLPQLGEPYGKLWELLSARFTVRLYW